MGQRIGIMGGTFDPVHFGHLRAAEETVEALELDALYFTPAATPPHKGGKAILDFDHRRRMLELAIRDHPKFALSDIERKLPGKSYTVVTLRRLLQDWANGVDLYFLVGLDAFLELNTWWHFQELFELARMCVLRRPPYDETAIEAFLRSKVSPDYAWEPGAQAFAHPGLLPVHYLCNTHLEISSTRIRELVARGRSIRYLVPPQVMRYIFQNELYAGWNAGVETVGEVMQHDAT
ncbi:MAG TPA: nicotinate-nucleotide adenylyltransferase [Syntrophobacter fumaroxidans]|nr:nicotinate-nucleotide adenylyltransferase [Syntrophobacter fumaroxidans]